MKICVWFAVNKYNEFIYLDESEMENHSKNQCRIIDMIDDMYSLNTEFDWEKIDSDHKPNRVGMYQAIVQFVQTAEDDFRIDVISCTPHAMI